MNTPSLKLKVIGLQGLYWMLFCSLYSFASVFLLSYHLSSTLIGSILAMTAVLVTFLQPLTGQYLKKAQVSLKKFLIVASIALAFVLLAALIFQNQQQLQLILFIISLLILLTLQPIINNFIFTWINQGLTLHFATSRAFGSLFFAICSFWLGKNLGSNARLPILTVALALSLCLSILVLTFPKSAPLKIATTQENKPVSVNIFKKHPQLIGILVGLFLLFIFHTIANVYLPQMIERTGGRIEDVGSTLSLAAFFEIPVMLSFPFVVKKISANTLLKTASFFYVIRCSLFLFFPSLLFIQIGQMMQGLCFGLYISSSTAFINDWLETDYHLQGHTFMIAATTLGGVAGSIGGGLMIDHFGTTQMLIGALITTLMSFIFLLISVPRKTKKLA